GATRDLELAHGLLHGRGPPPRSVHTRHHAAHEPFGLGSCEHALLAAFAQHELEATGLAGRPQPRFLQVGPLQLEHLTVRQANADARAAVLPDVDEAAGLAEHGAANHPCSHSRDQDGAENAGGSAAHEERAAPASPELVAVAPGGELRSLRAADADE